jgi:hypothetical protein
MAWRIPAVRQRVLGRAWFGTRCDRRQCDHSTDGTAVGTYTAYAAAKIAATGCESATRTTVTVTINDLPGAPSAGNVIACFDGVAHTGSATAGAGESVVWYDAATGGNVTTRRRAQLWEFTLRMRRPRSLRPVARVRPARR